MLLRVEGGIDVKVFTFVESIALVGTLLQSQADSIDGPAEEEFGSFGLSVVESEI